MFFVDLLLSASLSASVMAEEAVPLYVCYSQVQLTGTLDVVDQTLDKITKVVTIQNRIHAMTPENAVQVTAMASVVGLELDETQSRVKPENIKTFVALTKQPVKGTAVVFIGCNKLTLTR